MLGGCGKVSKLHNKAVDAIAVGDYDEAVELFGQAVELKPESAFYLNNLGWALFRNDNLDSALIVLERARRKAKAENLVKSIEVNRFLVNSFLRMRRHLDDGEFGLAKDEMEKVLNRYSAGPIGDKYLAEIFEGLEDYELASIHLDNIIGKYAVIDTTNNFYVFAIGRRYILDSLDTQPEYEPTAADDTTSDIQ